MNNVPFYTSENYIQQRPKNYPKYFWVSLSRTENKPKENEVSMANTSTLFLKAGDFEKCIEYAKDIFPLLTQKPSMHEVLKNWALALKKLCKWEELIKLQLKYIKTTFADYFTYLDIADTYHNSGDIKNCILYLELAVIADEANGADLEKLSELCLISGDYIKAGKYYGKAAANSILPNWNLWNKAAKSYLMAGDEHEAMFYLKVAVMIEPNNADTNYQIGLIYQNRNDEGKARHYFQEAIKANPRMALSNNLEAGHLSFKKVI